MNKTRKLLHLLVVTVFVMTSLIGFAQVSFADSASPVEITFWYPLGNDPDKPAIEQAVADFNAANPDIVVSGEYVANLPDKLQISINAGTAPDVSMFDRFMIGQWGAQGLLTPIDELCAEAGIDTTAFYEGPMSECVLDGVTYGLPNVMDTRCFYWNKTLFAAAGLDPEVPPTTFEELAEFADILTIKDGDRYSQVGFLPWYGQGSLYTYGWAFGGQFLDENGNVTANNPKVVEALQWLADYAKKYDIERLNSFQSSAGDINPFASGTLAMLLDGAWRAARLPEDLDFGITYIPTPAGVDHNSWSGGYGYIIPSGSKNEQAALRFIEYMTMGAGATYYGESTHSFLCNRELNEVQTWIQKDKFAPFFVTLLPISYCRPVISQGQLLSDELDYALDMALYGRGEPQELLDEVTQKVNKAMED